MREINYEHANYNKCQLFEQINFRFPLYILYASKPVELYTASNETNASSTISPNHFIALGARTQIPEWASFYCEKIVHFIVGNFQLAVGS